MDGTYLELYLHYRPDALLEGMVALTVPPPSALGITSYICILLLFSVPSLLRSSLFI